MPLRKTRQGYRDISGMVSPSPWDRKYETNQTMSCSFSELALENSSLIEALSTGSLIERERRFQPWLWR